MTVSSSSTRMYSGAPPSSLMQTAIVTGPRQAELVQVPIPEPGPRQVRVRLEGCGICASNGPVWEGRPWFEYPREPGSPGHEGWGVVDEIGSQVTHCRPGDRVAVLSYHAFAEYDVAEADQVLVLPADMADEPFPGEPLACAVNVLRRSAVQPGQVVAVVGIGFLGALLVQLIKHAGGRPIAISRRAWALEMAEQCGAERCFTMDDPHQVCRDVSAMTGSDGCPCVIEAVGNQRALDLASSLTSTRGRLVIAGFHQDGPRQIDLQSWNWRGLDVINAHERDPQVYMSGMQAAAKLVAAGHLDPKPLLTHRFPLSALPEALELSLARPAGFLKAWIDTSSTAEHPAPLFEKGKSTP